MGAGTRCHAAETAFPTIPDCCPYLWLSPPTYPQYIRLSISDALQRKGSQLSFLCYPWWGGGVGTTPPCHSKWAKKPVWLNSATRWRLHCSLMWQWEWTLSKTSSAPDTDLSFTCISSLYPHNNSLGKVLLLSLFLVKDTEAINKRPLAARIISHHQ